LFSLDLLKFSKKKKEKPGWLLVLNENCSSKSENGISIDLREKEILQKCSFLKGS
jgi:hypothetical protein